MKQSTNPYLPSYEYVPDGEPHLFGDRLYSFGSHDRFKGTVYCMNDYVCWSCDKNDLSKWRYEGVIYSRSQDPTPVKKMQHYMWAPDVVKGEDGRYYLYYAMESYNRINVAVCDTPVGKYEYLGMVRYKDGTPFGSRPMERYRFDPGVLNDNGNIYLYTGFSTNDFGWLSDIKKMTINGLGNEVTKLDKDMLTIIEEPKLLLPGVDNSKGTGFEGHEFFEASSIRKFDDKYYAIYSSILGHELAYAVSDYPDKEFKYGGTLHSNGGIIDGSKATYYWGNNHGSLERVNGEFYIFGHRQTYKRECCRQGIAEKIEFKDGKFIPAVMTSYGLCGTPLKCFGEYETGIACILYDRDGACYVPSLKGDNYPYITQDGKDRMENPGQYIARVKNETVFGFRSFDIDKKCTLILEYKGHYGRNARGLVQLSFSEDFNEVMEAKLDTRDNNTVSFVLNKEGVKTLYFRYLGTGTVDFVKLKFK